MAKKQKFFKYLLASSAIASIVASLGSSSVAFGGAVPNGVLMINNAELTDTVNGDQNNWNKIDQNGLSVNPSFFVDAPQDNKAFTYNANFTLNANRQGAIITAINLANHQPGDLTVNENLSIGSIVRNAGGANTLPIKIVAGHTATLTGTPATVDHHGFVAAANDYTGLGYVELGGAASTLIVHSNNGEDIAVGNVSTGVHQQSVLTFETGGTVGRIGANGTSLATVNIGAGAVTLGENVWADHTNLTHANSEVKVKAGKLINGNVVNTSGADSGTLNLERFALITGDIGADGKNNALATINIGDGAVLFSGNVFATNINLTNANSEVKVKAHKTITGNVVNTVGANNNGKLSFPGTGTVTGNIGAVGASLATIDINDGDVKLNGNVFTNLLVWYKNKTVTIGGDLTGTVDFNRGGTLIFDCASGPYTYTFDSEIENGDHGILNVMMPNLKATHQDIGKIKTININNNKTLTIDASNDNINLLGRVNTADPAVNQEIIFKNANSVLHLYSNAANKVTFAHDLPGGGAGGVVSKGIVWLEGAGGNTLTVSSVGGMKTLGTVNNMLKELQVRGHVTITGDNTVLVNNKLDVHNVGVLNIFKGARFTDESTTSAQIANVRIGSAARARAGVGPATYILDAKHTDFDILALGKAITFKHADSRLVLRNSAAGNKIITLQKNLDPGADNTGVVEFESVKPTAELKIDRAGLSLGIAGGNKLNKVIFSGAGTFKILPTIHSQNIELNANIVELDEVNSNILFITNTVFTAGNITGNVDFQDHDGTVKLAHGKTITGSVTSTGTGDSKGTLVFLGIGEVTGPITKLKMLRAGAGNVRLVGGNHTITEIQGNGVGNLIFANNFNLTGSINSTGGNAVGLIFKGNNGVSGVVGTAASPVGTIQVQGTTVFSDTVQTANDKDIIISDGATAEFANTVTTRDIKGAAAGQGTVRFNNVASMTINSAIGATNAVDTLDIAEADVAITQASANYISFSNAKEATLTLEGTSTVGGIRTVGNNVHTLALAADFTTGVQDIGSENNRLKSIKLLGDHKITIKSGLYSDISTKTNNTGKVVFNSDRSFAYNLGTDKLRLSDVTFANNATVKGDVYSKQITIASNKTATFAGTKSRTISVPNLTVDGSSISRSLKSFAYSTQIGSDEIKNEGITKFDNAVLVNTKINGGKVTFADNVWFKQTADGTKVSFAADKFVILEQNIRFANIKADKAKIIILPKTAAITGDLAAKDFTVDLAVNKLQYTGKAQLTGKIELVTAYDTSNGEGGNIEVQTGSKLDLSKADELIIKVKAQTDINKIPKGTKYVVISSVDGNGLVAIDHSKIKLDPTGEQNRFVQWFMDSSDLKLYITDISKEVIDKEIADKSLPVEDREFLKILNEVTDPQSDDAKFRNNIGNMDKKNAHLAIEKLLPGNENPIRESLARNLTSEIMTMLMVQTASQIAVTRMGNAVPMQNAKSAIGAGDDDQVMYGVWGIPFYSIAHQKVNEGVSGYTSKSFGGIVGFDGLVNDNLLFGAAYSQIDTQMFHQNQKIGDKTNGKTNIFSLYSLYYFSNNWFTEAIASYGITRVKNSEGRLIATKVKTVTALETAAAKYKSISYSGQLLAGHNYRASEKLMITPTIGLRYSQFKDAGYTESGTKFQNLVVKKRSYNKLEGILGLRTAIILKVNKVLLIPEFHGYVNHDFKGKSPIIDARLDGINKPLPTKLVKPAKTFFTVGTGLTVKYNMMECGVSYNANIANKYIGHQGSLKVKVNF